jgi:hypothetical protein
LERVSHFKLEKWQLTKLSLEERKEEKEEKG